MPDKKQNNDESSASESFADQETVVRVGEFFRAERLKKDITLKEVAESTSIRSGMLQALEENDRDSLPAEVFVRGFIRIYAEYLGLDPEDCLARYWEEEGEARQGHDGINVQKMMKLISVDEEPAFSVGRIFGLVFLVLFLSFLGYQGFSILTDSESSIEQAEIEPPPASLTTGKDVSAAGSEQEDIVPASNPEPGPVETEQEAQADLLPREVGAAEQLPQEFKYVLEVRFLEDTWLWVQIDGMDSQEFTFHDGERYIWEAQEFIDIYFGNAGGVELNLNGRRLPKLGDSGKTIKVSIPQDFSG